MKKLLLITILLFGFTSNIYAEDICNNQTTSTGVCVVVTEKIPGAKCDMYYGDTKVEKSTKIDENDFLNIRYACKVKKGFGSVISMMGKMIKYFTLIVALAGVLFIVIDGIMLSMGGMDSSIKEEAKKRITKTIIGLIVLFLSGVILHVIAPWIYK